MDEEQKRLAGRYDNHDGADPELTLLVFLTFLTEKIWHLPEERCLWSKEKALSEKPGGLDLIYGHGHKTDAQKAARKRHLKYYSLVNINFCGVIRAG